LFQKFAEKEASEANEWPAMIWTPIEKRERERERERGWRSV